MADFAARNTWKSVPNVSQLTPSLCRLMLALLASSPNAMLPIKKMEYAVLSCQSKSPVNLSRINDVDFATKIGLRLRILASKYMALINDLELREKALAKVPSPKP